MAMRCSVPRSLLLLRDRPFFDNSDFERFFVHSLLNDQPQSTSQRIGDVVKTEAENQVSVNVSQFKPEEIKVNVVDNQLIIEGKHEEKSDKHGQIQRHFIRKYTLPQGVRAEQIKSELNNDGVLSITYEKAPENASTSIPITFKN